MKSLTEIFSGVSSMNYKDAEIPCSDITVTLWYVRDITAALYPTKIVAEAAARARWPGENPDVRYGRIGCMEFIDANFCDMHNDAEHEK